MSKNLLNKLFSFSIGTIITFALSAVTTPVITRMVSPEQYGLYSMFTLFVSFSSVLLVFGLDHSFARYYLEFENHENELFKKILIVPVIITLVYITFFIFFGEGIIQLFFNEYNRTIILLVVTTSVIGMINRFVLLSIRMSQNGKLYSLTMVIQKSIFVLVTIGLLFLFKDYLVISFAYFISILLGTFFGIYVSRNSRLSSNTHEVKVNVSTKELVLYGSPMVFTFLTMWLFQYSDRLFINHYYGYSELGIYAAAFSIIALLNLVKDSFVTFWAPVSFERYMKDGNNVVFFKNINNIVSLIMFLLCVSIILFKDIIIFALGSQYREASRIMPFLMFMPVMYTISETTVIGINFKKKSTYHTLISVTTLAINLIGNSLLVPNYGSEGAAISTGISYIIFFYLRTFVSGRLYPVKYEWKKIVIANLLTMILAFISTFSDNIMFNSICSIATFIIILLIYKKTALSILNAFIKKSAIN
jgi:O-antigen/teichoic acid export membrane protein